MTGQAGKVKRRDANIIMVSLAALGGGFVAYGFPVDLLEISIRATGLATIFPAFASPLGETARVLLVTGGACVASALTAAFLPWRKRRRRDGVKRNSGMTFAFSKLTALLRRNRMGEDGAFGFAGTPEIYENVVPVLRRSDAHPDAPPRPPLFASRDLGDEPLPPVDIGDYGAQQPEGSRGSIVADITGLAMPRAPEPLPWETIEQEMERLLAGTRFRNAEENMPGNGEDGQPATSQQSIRDLTDRLERGLARLRAANRPDGGGSSARDTTQAANDVAAPVDRGGAGNDADRTLPPPETTDRFSVDWGSFAPFSSKTGDGTRGADSDLGSALAALRGMAAKAS